MGSPPMNLVQAEVREGRLRLAGVEIPLPAGRRADGPVIAGVRPTDLKPAGPESDPGLPRLGAELEVVERLGAESHLIFAIDAPRLAGDAASAADEATEERDATLLAEDDRARLTARFEGRRRFAPGEPIEFTVRPDSLHLFDAATGAAL
jgi:ABC-type sugar transport system ATPase subunit